MHSGDFQPPNRLKAAAGRGAKDRPEIRRSATLRPRSCGATSRSYSCRRIDAGVQLVARCVTDRLTENNESDKAPSMSGFKEPSFADRQKAAQQARKNILNKFKAQPGPDDPAVKARQADG